MTGLEWELILYLLNKPQPLKRSHPLETAHVKMSSLGATGSPVNWSHFKLRNNDLTGSLIIPIIHSTYISLVHSLANSLRSISHVFSSELQHGHSASLRSWSQFQIHWKKKKGRGNVEEDFHNLLPPHGTIFAHLSCLLPSIWLHSLCIQLQSDALIMHQDPSPVTSSTSSLKLIFSLSHSL